jgi:hypothetical protein
MYSWSVLWNYFTKTLKLNPLLQYDIDTMELLFIFTHDCLKYINYYDGHHGIYYNIFSYQSYKELVKKIKVNIYHKNHNEDLFKAIIYGTIHTYADTHKI